MERLVTPTPTASAPPTTPSTTDERLARLDAKMDLLLSEVHQLSRRQRALEELREDLSPVIKEAWRVLVTELAALDGQFSLEDLGELVRRLLRNTRNLTAMVDQLQSMQGLAEDLRRLSKEMFAAAVERLNGLEQNGTLAFLRENMRVFETIVAAFSTEDVRLLGDNIVLMLETLRSLTQPEILRMLERSFSVVRREDVPPGPKGVLGMVRTLHDAEVQRGLGLAIEMLRQIARSDGTAD